MAVDGDKQYGIYFHYVQFLSCFFQQYTFIVLELGGRFVCESVGNSAKMEISFWILR